MDNLTKLQEQKQQLINETIQLNELKQVLNSRQEVLKQEIANMQIIFHEQNAELLNEIAQLNGKVNQLDEDLRTGVIEAYKVNPLNKQLGEGMSVRVTEIISISDKVAANEWAKKEATFLLVVDEKQLKDLAKKQNFPFITKSQTISAVIKLEMEIANK